jgi:hypothetical protein
MKKYEGSIVYDGMLNMPPINDTFSKHIPNGEVIIVR